MEKERLNKLTILANKSSEWMVLANCAGVDPNLFFPESGSSASEAKEVCRGCIVSEQCLNFALTNGEKYGIWGGLSERERKRIRSVKHIGTIAV